MRVITLGTGNKVVGVKNVGEDYVLETNDIVTELGEIGQIRQPDGSFTTPPIVPVTPVPTLEERFSEVNANQLTIMDAIADLYIAMMPG